LTFEDSLVYDSILVDELDYSLDIFRSILVKYNLITKVKIIKSGQIISVEKCLILPPIHYTPPALMRKRVLREDDTLFHLEAMKRVRTICMDIIGIDQTADKVLYHVLYINRTGIRKVNFAPLVEDGDMARSFDNLKFSEQIHTFLKFSNIVCTSGGFLALLPFFLRNTKVLILYNAPTKYSGWLTLGYIAGLEVCEYFENNKENNSYRLDSKLSRDVVLKINEFNGKYAVEE